jgi:hypothetical protein
MRWKELPGDRTREEPQREDKYGGERKHEERVYIAGSL